ncbi:MAG TPA: phosphonate C-P lyase system protein PhnH [Acetobacteraceae bacterium]
MTGLELAGFADPVTDAQRCFRATLDAMARPGLVREAGVGLLAPPPLDPATASVLLTLVDGDVSLWLDPAFSTAGEWLTFHCGVCPVSDPTRASFLAGRTLVEIGGVEIGSHEEPETGATFVLQVASLETGQRYRLRGPGLREAREIAVTGLPDDFATIWRANHASFPRGIDLILCAGTRLMALPRSVAVEEA